MFCCQSWQPHSKPVFRIHRCKLNSIFIKNWPWLSSNLPEDAIHLLLTSRILEFCELFAKNSVQFIYSKWRVRQCVGHSRGRFTERRGRNTQGPLSLLSISSLSAHPSNGAGKNCSTYLNAQFNGHDRLINASVCLPEDHDSSSNAFSKLMRA